jgi:glycine/D-amino acid oxidase-like deaminating enzyme
LSGLGEVRIMRGMARQQADVAVLGAGLAGLLASLGFARSGRRVVLLERDGPGVTGNADVVFERWARPGSRTFASRTTF